MEYAEIDDTVGWGKETLGGLTDLSIASPSFQHLQKYKTHQLPLPSFPGGSNVFLFLLFLSYTFRSFRPSTYCFYVAWIQPNMKQ
ncbi:hypothetical protein VTL71DRAFT_16287 [Oculimacula yallundae]|uniref:Uncharacterized protein n=1 Tax=Oculimacula yallundae TaxID=86028 RepID=A0ABR4CE03_9HELO